AMQQAIQLLQLSTADLQQVVQRELVENPLLDETEPDAESGDGAIQAAAGEPSPEAAEQPASGATLPDPLLDLGAIGDDGPPARSLVAEEERSDRAREGVLRSVRSLSDHLDEQLRLATGDPHLIRLGRAIIGNLDDDGYLRAELDDIARGCDASAAEVGRALALVQTFDPPGVAARSARECLLLQLRAEPRPDEVAVAIVEDRLADLGRRRYGDL